MALCEECVFQQVAGGMKRKLTFPSGDVPGSLKVRIWVLVPFKLQKERSPTRLKVMNLSHIEAIIANRDYCKDA